MNSAPLMLRLVDLKNAKEDLGKNCVALYEASSGDGSLNDDGFFLTSNGYRFFCEGHCGKSSTLPDSALPHKECPDDGKFQKAQRLAAERETTYAPFVPKEVLLPSNNGNELEIDSAKSHEQLALLVQSKSYAHASSRVIHGQDMVVGGTDTTINSVEAAMAEMMNKPQVMQKLQLELDTIVGKDHIVEECHIPKLPYLYAIMKETLRLHPILPLLMPHSPSETCTKEQDDSGARTTSCTYGRTEEQPSLHIVLNKSRRTISKGFMEGLEQWELIVMPGRHL
ncbi:unnamed protein product [Camellia sinensis]